MFDYDSEAVRAAVEFHRRSRKGLPADRWASGNEGMQLVADGIGEIVRALGASTALLQAYEEAERQRGIDAMDPTADPMRSD